MVNECPLLHESLLSQLLDMAYDATSTESKGEKNSGFLNPNFM